MEAVQPKEITAKTPLWKRIFLALLWGVSLALLTKKWWFLLAALIVFGWISVGEYYSVRIEENVFLIKRGLLHKVNRIEVSKILKLDLVSISGEGPSEYMVTVEYRGANGRVSNGAIISERNREDWRNLITHLKMHYGKAVTESLAMHLLSMEERDAIIAHNMAWKEKRSALNEL